MITAERGLSAVMLDVVAWTWQFAITACVATNVDLGLPGGLLGLFRSEPGLPMVGKFPVQPCAQGSAKMNMLRCSPNSKAYPLGSRFLALQLQGADDSLPDRHDDLKAQFEVWHHEISTSPTAANAAL